MKGEVIRVFVYDYDTTLPCDTTIRRQRPALIAQGRAKIRVSMWSDATRRPYEVPQSRCQRPGTTDRTNTLLGSGQWLWPVLSGKPDMQLRI